ncbi:MAG: hypothetical protein J0L97_08665 [Alphaproteobacteria bacterium]|nr:hypothetical protein [Alphaproteobacteria bacterium]
MTDTLNLPYTLTKTFEEPLQEGVVRIPTFTVRFGDAEAGNVEVFFHALWARDAAIVVTHEGEKWVLTTNRAGQVVEAAYGRVGDENPPPVAVTDGHREVASRMLAIAIAAQKDVLNSEWSIHEGREYAGTVDVAALEQARQPTAV